jgi:hypothetical protein
MGKKSCNHPPNRVWAWYARDDSIVRKHKVAGAGNGEILCLACCDCGEVLEGGVDPDSPKLLASSNQRAS